jgi:exonuclease SbcC
MRQRYKDLEAETASLQQFNQDLAHLLARHEQLQESTAEAQQLTEQAAALDRELAEQTFAPDQRERLRQLTDEIAQLGYQAKEHAALRQTLADLRKVETEHALLQDARNQADKLTGERTDAQEKRDLALNYLEGRLYAQEEQEALQDVKQQTATLGYDEEEHQQLRRKLDDFSDVVARLERLQAARGRSDSVDETLQRYEEEFQTLGKQLREAEQSQDDLEKRAAELAGVEKRLADNASQLERHRIERDELLQRQGALKTLCTRCAKLAQEQEKLQQALKGDQRQVWIYQRLDEAFGKDGIQALIIENAIPQIEQEANAILSRLTDNRIRVTFDSLRDLKKGGTRETLDVKIADEIGERSYHLYSGGEAFRTNFALRIALSKVLAMRAGTRLRTLFIDEGFGTQDSQGLEQLVEAIQVISRDFDKVLVVTHLDQLKAAFPVQIEVTKHPDLGSRFEVFHHG